MKRVLIFALTYYPSLIGGDGVAIKEITDRIDPSDIEFHLITIRFDSNLPKEEKLGNVFVYRIGFTRPNPTPEELKRFPLHYMKAIYQFSAAWKAIMLHRKYGFDATWAMMAHSSGVPAALFKLLNPKVPYVLTLQEGDPPEYIERVMRPFGPLFPRAFTSANMVQVISGFLGDWARRMGYQGTIELIPNGASVDKTKYTEEEKLAFAREIGKKPGDVYLVNVSRLVNKNAVDDCIRAIALLPKHIYLLAVGGGPDEEMLKGLAQELGVEDRVIFTGQVDRTMTAKYRMISEIFVRPSRSEGMGNSFASAMASRIPIIATQEGGLSDFIFDAKRNPDRETTAWVVDKDSPQQIADAVTDILAHPEQAEKVVDTCYKLVMEKYNWDFIARDMREKVFGRVLTPTINKV